jgi:hypothetical protein
MENRICQECSGYIEPIISGDLCCKCYFLYLGLDVDKKNNDVHKSEHYTYIDGIECIDVTKNFDYLLSNAIKYILRHGKKEGQDAAKDLNKAIFYIQKKINEIGNNT